jgi:hypothetical protein
VRRIDVFLLKLANVVRYRSSVFVADTRSYSGKEAPFPGPKTVKNDRERKRKKRVVDMEAVRPFPDPKSPNVYPKHRLPCPRSRRHIAYIIRTDAFKEKEKMKQKRKEKEKDPSCALSPLVSTQRM